MKLLQEGTGVAGSFLRRIKRLGANDMRMKELVEVPWSSWRPLPGTLRASALAFVSVQGRLVYLFILLMPYKGRAGRTLGGRHRWGWWRLLIGHQLRTYPLAEDRLLGYGPLRREECG